MQFFLDTADLTDIKDLLASGMVDGVTTNPSLVAQQSGQNFLALTKDIAAMVQGPVSAEVTATDYETMQKEADKLVTIAKNVVIKVPLTEAGLRVCKNLTDSNHKVNVTLCFSAAQALLAAKAGATYVSVFVGRLDDIGHDGIAILDEVIQIFRQHPDIHTKVLAASLRHVQHVVMAAKVGADVVTMPPKILRQMFAHPLTDKGLAAFTADWQKTGQSIL
ncbi:MAG TPA: fructose-6-phosphate aldolase [Alphaproteobacteria bacterium]